MKQSTWSWTVRGFGITFLALSLIFSIITSSESMNQMKILREEYDKLEMKPPPTTCPNSTEITISSEAPTTCPNSTEITILSAEAPELWSITEINQVELQIWSWMMLIVISLLILINSIKLFELNKTSFWVGILLMYIYAQLSYKSIDQIIYYFHALPWIHSQEIINLGAFNITMTLIIFSFIFICLGITCCYPFQRGGPIDDEEKLISS